MNKLFRILTLLLVFSGLTLEVQASVFRLTPPPTLIINGQSVVQGQFTLEGLSGIDLSLNEIIALDPADSADDIMHTALIGSNVQTNLISDLDFPVLKFNYTFDAVIPDLIPIQANVLNAAMNFTIFLPMQTGGVDFYQVTDHLGNTSFFSVAPMLSLVPTKSIFIDLIGDQTIFANFDAGTMLDPTLYKPHGNVSWVPIPGAVWLFATGLIGLIGTRKRLHFLPSL